MVSPQGQASSARDVGASFASPQEQIIDNFRKHADKVLLKHLRPVDYKIVDDIPLTLFGKVDYQKVDQMYT